MDDDNQWEGGENLSAQKSKINNKCLCLICLVEASDVGSSDWLIDTGGRWSKRPDQEAASPPHTRESRFLAAEKVDEHLKKDFMPRFWWRLFLKPIPAYITERAIGGFCFGPLGETPWCEHIKLSQWTGLCRCCPNINDRPPDPYFGSLTVCPPKHICSQYGTNRAFAPIPYFMEPHFWPNVDFSGWGRPKCPFRS